MSTEEFLKLDPSAGHDLDINLVKKGIIEGFLKFDDDMEKKERDEKSGSTAVIAFITPTHIIVGNCGDSRAIVVRDDRPVLETVDHKPNLPNERKRISDAGGQVMLSRVNGSLAVSRYLLSLCLICTVPFRGSMHIINRMHLLQEILPSSIDC